MKQAIQCKSCKDIIASFHRHDFKWCKCGLVAIDGGDDYTHIVGELGNFDMVQLHDLVDLPK